jgi:hypothetical protein
MRSKIGALLLACLISLLACVSALSLVRASGQVVVLNSQGLIDQSDTYHVLGEVENAGDAPVSGVNITATGYDADGTVVATSSTLADLDVLLPGDKSPFDVLLYDASSNYLDQVVSYNLSFSYYAGEWAARELEIVSNSSYIDPVSDLLYVTGNLTNLGPGITTHVTVIATFYDSDENVVWVDEVYSEPHDLWSNGNASFTLVLSDDIVIPLVAGYNLTAESDQYEMVLEYQFLYILPLLIMTGAVAVMLRKSQTIARRRQR